MSQWDGNAVVHTPRHIPGVAVLVSGLLAVAVSIAVFRSFRGVSPTTVGVTLLLVVLATATFGRLWTAIVVAFVATAGLNFYFFPPVGTFAIAEPHNWVALIAFSVAAVIASNLSTAAQTRARDAIARRNEVTRLFDLTRDVLLTSEASGALDALARHVARRFELPRVAICLPAVDGWQIHQVGNDTVRIAKDALDRALSHAVTVAGAADAILPLRQGPKTIGLLVVPALSAEHGALDAVAGVVAIAIERTQLLREREAAEIVRQKGELANTLLASLSHDLRTPLTAVRVAVENLREDVPPADRRSQAEAAIVELERLSRLFEDILHMARIDAAAIHVERQWVTPADIVDAATAQVRHAVRHHPLRIDAQSDVQVDIDPRVASVALSHLLENAARYSSARTDILIEARADHDGLRMTVTDHGSGLDPAEVDRVFDRFYRGRAARMQSPGTGMGLSITRGLLAAVGGRVWGENAAGAGARFIIVIPAQTRAVALRA